MQLPRGITGFHMATDSPLPSFEAHDFTTVSYAVAHDLDASVIARDVQPHPARSYMVVTLQDRHERWSLLGHATYPIVACVTGSADSHGLAFVDLPSLSAIAPGFGVDVYLASFLTHAVDPRWLTNLAEVEWRPDLVLEAAAYGRHHL